MPLEVRELVVQVEVGSAPPAVPGRLADAELEALKREIIEACLAEVRRQTHAENDR